MVRPSQGEALGAWMISGAVTLAVLVTYGRLDTAELYNVSNEGLAGGLGRAVVLLNFPIALVAIALTLIAVAALPRRGVGFRWTGDRFLRRRRRRCRPERSRRSLGQRCAGSRRRAGACADGGGCTSRWFVVRAAPDR